MGAMISKTLDQNYKEITRKSGSNFYISLFFLPKRKREAMSVVYAWARLIDDVVDEPGGSVVEKKAELEELRQEIKRAFKGIPKTKMGRELAQTASYFNLTEQYFQELVSGVAVDLKPKRFQTHAELKKYCYGVAGTVGLICMEIFGVRHAKGREYAVMLGEAFQLTNILRDVGGDLKEGRFYLPLDDLKKFGCTEKTVNESLILFEAEKAEACFKRADELLTSAERRKVLASRIMAAVYYEILERIKEEPLKVLKEKIRIGSAKKIKLVVLSLLGAKRIKN